MDMLHLPETSAVRILVVGDVMLDRYWFGEVSRISPEAPVPVLKFDRSEDRPGGAANVARNLDRVLQMFPILGRRRAQEAGFDHHLTKPVDFAALEPLLRASAAPAAAR